MSRQHNYKLTIKWTGNKGTGTSSYRGYERNHSILSENKPEIFCSSDPAFRGDKAKYNPEELLVASLSSCHMLWFLHLCSEVGIVVVNYEDHATGIMEETPSGSGHFLEVTLNPVVIVSKDSKADKINVLHKKANKLCFIANSVNFPVRHNPSFSVGK